MKKNIILSLITLSLLATFSACTTYDEGPAFTVISAESRIKGTWEQTAFLVGDEDQANSIMTEFTINSDGTGIQTVTVADILPITTDIEWQFNDDKTLFQSREIGDTEWNEMTIKRLTLKELWLIQDAGIWGIWEFRLEKV